LDYFDGCLAAAGSSTGITEVASAGADYFAANSIGCFCGAATAWA